MNSAHFRKLENLMHSAPFVQLAAARVTINEGSSVITIPVDRKLHHAAHALHGALYFLALDNAAFFAVNSLIEDVFVLTVTFNIYLLKPVTQGTITAYGSVISKTKSLYIAESVAYDDNKNEIARGSGSFMRSKIPLTPDIGYA